MSGSTRSEAAEPAILSRRQAIAGALALAAGALIASKPEVAAAVNGETITAGNDFFVSDENAFRLTSNGTSGGDEIAYAVINRNGGTSDPVRAFGGTVFSAAPVGSSGVQGEAWNAQHQGVSAVHHSLSGTALKVEGRASFTRSGKATVSKKHSTRTVTVASGIDPTSMILVTLQGSGGSGVWLKYAKRMSATTFKVYLNKKTTKAVAFAWMIVD